MSYKSVILMGGNFGLGKYKEQLDSAIDVLMMSGYTIRVPLFGKVNKYIIDYIIEYNKVIYDRFGHMLDVDRYTYVHNNQLEVYTINDSNYSRYMTNSRDMDIELSDAEQTLKHNQYTYTKLIHSRLEEKMDVYETFFDGLFGDNLIAKYIPKNRMSKLISSYRLLNGYDIKDRATRVILLGSDKLNISSNIRRDHQLSLKMVNLVDVLARKYNIKVDYLEDEIEW